MSEINLKLKSYDELIFEITTLNTNKYLLEQKVNKQKEVLDKIKEKVNQYELIKGYYDYIEENGYAETTSHDTLKEDILELLEEIE